MNHRRSFPSRISHCRLCVVSSAAAWANSHLSNDPVPCNLFSPSALIEYASVRKKSILMKTSCIENDMLECCRETDMYLAHLSVCGSEHTCDHFARPEFHDLLYGSLKFERDRQALQHQYTVCRNRSSQHAVSDDLCVAAFSVCRARLVEPG